MKLLNLVFALFPLLMASGILKADQSIPEEQESTTLKASKASMIEGFLRNGKLFNDGSGRIGFTVSIPSSKKSSQSHAVDFSIETQLLEHHLNVNDGEASLVTVPIEVHAALQVNEPQSAKWQDARIGMAKILIDSIGLSGQVLSYVYRNLDADIGQSQSLQVLSVNFENAYQQAKSDRLQIVLRGSANIGFGMFDFSAADMASKKTDVMRRLGYLNDVASQCQAGGLLAVVNGGIGLRIAKRVLFNLFFGIDYSALSRSDRSNGHYMDSYIGAGLRVRVKDWLLLHFGYRRDLYEVRLASGILSSDYKSHVDSFGNAIEVHW